MPSVLVADKMHLGKSCPSALVAMKCNVLTSPVVVGLLLLIVLRNASEDCMNMALNDYAASISEEHTWYSSQRLNSVLHRLSEFQRTKLLGYPVYLSALEPIPIVWEPGVLQILKSVLDTISDSTNSHPVSYANSANELLTYKNLNPHILTCQKSNGIFTLIRMLL